MSFGGPTIDVEAVIVASNLAAMSDVEFITALVVAHWLVVIKTQLLVNNMRRGPKRFVSRKKGNVVLGRTFKETVLFKIYQQYTIKDMLYYWDF